MTSIYVKPNGAGVLRGMGIHKQAQWILGEGVLPFLPPERIRHKKSSSSRRLLLFWYDCFSFAHRSFSLGCKQKKKTVLPLKEQNRLLPVSTFLSRVDVELQASLMQFLLAEPTRSSQKVYEINGGFG